MMRTISLLSAFLFLASIPQAQTIYLKYDEECMDRLEYSSNAESVAYVSYRFDLGDGKLIHFDIGKEAVKWVKDLPGKVIRCEDLVFDKEMVRKINSGSLKVSMIRESPTHYNVSPVQKAVFIDNYRTGVEVVMDDAEFVLDMSSLISNRNISKPSSRLAVFLDGTINYQCVKGYIVKKMENFNAKDFKEYILIPELGIVEKRALVNGGTAISGQIKLNRVDAYSLSETITGICDGMQANYYDSSYQGASNQGSAGTATTTAKTVEKQATPENGEVPTSYETSPCGPQAPGFHFVRKGETLYSISRRYGVSVDQLKSWNGMRNNTISVCQKLRVAPAANTGSTGSTGNNRPTTTAENGAGYWVAGSEHHIVRPNESVAALANMYGYTEERFRRMNNLSPYERIYAGQELQTSDCVCPTMESTTAGRPLPYEEKVEVVESLTQKGNPDVYFRPIRVHQVRSGETLFSVAKQYDTTVDRIRELNGLNSNSKLAKGQKLYVQ